MYGVRGMYIDLFVNAHGVINPHIALIRLENNDFVVQPSLCHQWELLFESAAWSDRKDERIVTINKEKCIGCKMCQEYCPYRAIIIRNKSLQCELWQ